ncbi:Rha family transcriptional regulator [Acetobacter aceti]|uniref:DNA-binding protein n=1 Tax=Acetobacter aceti TaxID=435 RepID=A0A6S6PL51_ACEAC|nr:Rha family transcriptional regulator [Acetobacter aceti]BCI68073.1 hypothetical protein AAJCM20276_26970 [Acetobacter aceti]
MNILTAPIATMSSREIAELTEKRHDHVIRDIEKMLDDVKIDRPKFGGVYIDAKGEERKCYNLPKNLTLNLIAGYRADLRLKIIDRWMELEAAPATPAIPSEIIITDMDERGRKMLGGIVRSVVLSLLNTTLSPIGTQLEKLRVDNVRTEAKLDMLLDRLPAAEQDDLFDRPVRRSLRGLSAPPSLSDQARDMVLALIAEKGMVKRNVITRRIQKILPDRMERGELMASLVDAGKIKPQVSLSNKASASLVYYSAGDKMPANFPKAPEPAS